MKNIFILTGIVLLLAGCANNRISLGDNHFRVTKQATSEMNDVSVIETGLVAEANQHCGRVKPSSVANIISRKVATHTGLNTDQESGVGDKSELRYVELEYACII